MNSDDFPRTASVVEKERRILEIVEEMRELVTQENGNATR